MGKRKLPNVIIRHESYWTYVEPRHGFELPNDWDIHGGKLMVFGDEQYVVSLVERLSIYVSGGEIRTLKYAPPLPPQYKTWAIMVYCLDSEQDRVWEILKLEGVTRKLWKLDKQTEIDWKPGGKLYSKFYGEYEPHELATYCKQMGIPLEVGKTILNLPIKRIH